MKTKTINLKKPLGLLILFTLLVSCSDSNSDNRDDDLLPTQIDISSVDNAIESFMITHQVPGASLAVSVNGKMVYNKGYGFANVEKNLSTETNHRFRIASISKVFTSVAIMTLVEDGVLNLDDSIFGNNSNSILGEDYNASLSANELEITLDDLLLHEQGGWISSQGFDIIDYVPSLNNSEFLEYILNNSRATSKPGTLFSYNNTGYWLLARIIEAKSGKTYEQYLKDMVAPLGITSLKVTNFTSSDLESDEVLYYGNTSDSQYIYSIASRRDGDAGVVISAPDLLRFINAIDGNNILPDIISAQSYETLKRTSLSNLGRGFTTWDAQDLLYFTGSLPGNRSWFMISNNGRSAVLLFNHRGTNTQQYDSDFQSILLDIVNNNSIPWQTDLDQF